MSNSRNCKKHGGTLEDDYDAWWLCDGCNSKGLDPCKCGSDAAIFGEALMQSVTCKSCDEFVMCVNSDKNIRELWNSGQRGMIE